jgi:hypothetical protein
MSQEALFQFGRCHPALKIYEHEIRLGRRDGNTNFGQ